MQKKQFRNRKLSHLISAPFIYSVIFPIVIADVFFSVYHAICFRLYKLPLLKRSDYVRVDRHRLDYLNWFEKLNCAYCGYANGVIQYMSVIAAQTELYWCGIKHEESENFHAPKHHKHFSKYGNKSDFERKYLKK